MKNRLLVVIPCYNEEDALPITCSAVLEKVKSLINCGRLSNDSGIVFVNDGSRDKTWDIIKGKCAEHSFVYGINLAANVGHQSALMAGLEYAKNNADFAISMDADMQDDISVIDEMVEKYLSGADIVFGVRENRESDSWFKRTSAEAFYKLMNLLGAKTVYNHADFRLMSKRALDALSEYKETNLFLRGIVAGMGFKTEKVFYVRNKRNAGESKYSLRNMIKFATRGVTSFSIKPISLVTWLGFFIIICSLAALVYTLISYITGNYVPGWSSLMLSIWFIGGVQLFCIGLVGKYVGETYMEVKRRPRYHIEEVIDGSKDETK